MSDRFRVLFVCTGNICRSPMAQVLLTHRLRQRLGDDRAAAYFEVRSAGTYGLAGHPIEGAAMDALTGLGVTADPFEARELVAQHVEDADLVLGATREHRAAVVTLVPRASSRTFTIREFARLVSTATAAEAVGSQQDLVEHARAVVRAAAGQRGYSRPDRPDDDDIADPYRRAAEAFELAGRQISAAVDTITDALTLADIREEREIGPA